MSTPLNIRKAITDLATIIGDLKVSIDTLSMKIDSLAPEPAGDAGTTRSVNSQRVKNERNTHASKRPPTIFMSFAQTERAKTPNIKLTAAELAGRWAALSNEQKRSYKPSAGGHRTRKRR